MTVAVGKLRLQIAPQSTRWSYAQCRVKGYEHLDGCLTEKFPPSEGKESNRTQHGELPPHNQITEFDRHNSQWHFEEGRSYEAYGRYA